MKIHCFLSKISMILGKKCLILIFQWFQWKILKKLLFFFKWNFWVWWYVPPAQTTSPQCLCHYVEFFHDTSRFFYIFLIFVISWRWIYSGFVEPVMDLVVRISENIKKIMKIHVKIKKTQRSDINIPEKYPEPGGHVLNTKTWAWKKS